MPKQIRNAVQEKFSRNVRRKKNGVFELRFQMNNIQAYGASRDLKVAKARFIRDVIEKFSNVEETQKKESIFGEYAESWLELVKKPVIKEPTYRDYKSIFGQILSVFGKKKISEIKQFDVQAYLNALTEKGKERTAIKHYQVLNAIFEYAKGDGIVERIPTANVALPYHEEIHGRALDRAEEKELVERCLSMNTRSAKAFVLILYTGLRRAELSSATVDGEFLSVVTGKQRAGRKEKIRKIPISPRLRSCLPNVEKDLEDLRGLYPNRLSRTFKELFPDHHLHELRHTFITRAQECGISRELVSVWAGHKADNTMTSNVYTHFSEEYQIAEIKRFDYLF